MLPAFAGSGPTRCCRVPRLPEGSVGTRSRPRPSRLASCAHGPSHSCSRTQTVEWLFPQLSAVDMQTLLTVFDTAGTGSVSYAAFLTYINASPLRLSRA